MGKHYELVEVMRKWYRDDRYFDTDSIHALIQRTDAVLTDSDDKPVPMPSTIDEITRPTEHILGPTVCFKDDMTGYRIRIFSNHDSVLEYFVEQKGLIGTFFSDTKLIDTMRHEYRLILVYRVNDDDWDNMTFELVGTLNDDGIASVLLDTIANAPESGLK